MKKEDVQKQLKDSLVEDLEAFFSKIEDLILNTSAVYNDFILMKSRVRSLEKELNRNTISRENYSLEISQIKAGILSNIDRIKESDLIKKISPLDKLDSTLEATLGISLDNIEATKIKELADAKAYGIKRIAEAKAYEIKIIEGVKKDAELENREKEAQFIDRMQKRFLTQEAKKQNNIESVVHKAAQNLGEEPIDNTPIDKDWATRFFNIVADVSDEEMQKLWARILAGELKEPSTFSLRTLEMLRNLSREEAEVIQRVFQYVIMRDDGICFIYRYQDLPIGRVELSLLEELSLMVHSNLDINNSFRTAESKKTPYFLYGDIYFEIHYLTQPKFLESSDIAAIYLLTKTGKDLLKLIDIKPNSTYLFSFEKMVLNRTSNMVTRQITIASFPSVRKNRIPLHVVKIMFAKIVDRDSSPIKVDGPLKNVRYSKDILDNWGNELDDFSTPDTRQKNE